MKQNDFIFGDNDVKSINLFLLPYFAKEIIPPALFAENYEFHLL